MRFADRAEAGRRLAEALAPYRGQAPLVVGLPRGGVPVAFEVAHALRADLDVYVVRKLGAPGQPELGMGAVGPGGARVLNEDLIRRLGISGEELERITREKSDEVQERVHRFRGDRPPLDVRDRIVILVDDGIATGGTALVALETLRAQQPKRLILAVPVAPPSAMSRLEGVADEVVVLGTPADFLAVGQWYEDFTPTTDDDVERLLRKAAGGAGGGRGVSDPEVRIPAGDATLVGDLAVPGGACGVVVFAHGSGSGRHSPRNQRVAEVLQQAGLATLLIDLLPPTEQDAGSSFDADRLAARLRAAVRYLATEPTTADLAVGVIGSSTGAAVALAAAAEDPTIQAVVSRGGRPDLAADRLSRVTAPTRFIAGGADAAVLGVSRDAAARMGGEADLVEVPDATHLFSEPGTLDEAARLAADWFKTHLQERKMQEGEEG